MTDIDLTNTVEADNQIKEKNYIRFGAGEGRPKILFAGNSMLWHAPKADIGWNGDWGMAASCAENDYVHRAMKNICESYPQASYCMAQCAYWERNMNSADVYDAYVAAAEYDKDAIVIILGENIPECEHTLDELTDKFSELINYLRGNRETIPVLISKPFMWNKPLVSHGIEKAAENTGAVVMDMSELKSDLSFRAAGRFPHSGVAAHPGDKGMEKIACIICDNLKKHLDISAAF